MLKIHFTGKICREIVLRGTDPELDHQIHRRRISRGAVIENSGHLIGSVASTVSANSPGNVEVGAISYSCTAPLLGSETLSAGTLVIIQKNRDSGDWEIIAAQCPED
ncbi:MAG: hypothetical protein Q4G69_00805 [Planctomycetia bacterium]|nr:hypothetical protein [Planctomycetia bacterium]